jgi:hypothetical protein
MFSVVSSSPSILFSREVQIPHGVSYGPGAFHQFRADERSSLTGGPVNSTFTRISSRGPNILPATRLAISAQARIRLGSSVTTSGADLRSQQTGVSPDPVLIPSIDTRDLTNADQKAAANTVSLDNIKENTEPDLSVASSGPSSQAGLSIVASPTSQYATAVPKDSPGAWRGTFSDSVHEFSSIYNHKTRKAKYSVISADTSHSNLTYKRPTVPTVPTQPSSRPSTNEGSLSYAQILSRKACRKSKKVQEQEVRAQQSTPAQRLPEKKPDAATASKINNFQAVRVNHPPRPGNPPTQQDWGNHAQIIKQLFSRHKEQLCDEDLTRKVMTTMKDVYGFNARLSFLLEREYKLTTTRYERIRGRLRNWNTEQRLLGREAVGSPENRRVFSGTALEDETCTTPAFGNSNGKHPVSNDLSTGFLKDNNNLPWESAVSVGESGSMREATKKEEIEAFATAHDGSLELAQLAVESLDSEISIANQDYTTSFTDSLPLPFVTTDESIASRDPITPLVGCSQPTSLMTTEQFIGTQDHAIPFLGSLPPTTLVISTVQMPRHQMITGYISTPVTNIRDGPVTITLPQNWIPVIYVNPKEEKGCRQALLTKMQEMEGNTWERRSESGSMTRHNDRDDPVSVARTSNADIYKEGNVQPPHNPSIGMLLSDDLKNSLSRDHEPVLSNGIEEVRSGAVPFIAVDQESFNNARNVSPLGIHVESPKGQHDDGFEELTGSTEQTNFRNRANASQNGSRPITDNHKQEKPTENHDNSCTDLTHATILELLEVMANDEKAREEPNRKASSTSSIVETKVMKIFRGIDVKMRDRNNSTQEVTSTTPYHGINPRSSSKPEIDFMSMKKLILDALRTSADPEIISMTSKLTPGDAQGQKTMTYEENSTYQPHDDVNSLETQSPGETRSRGAFLIGAKLTCYLKFTAVPAYLKQHTCASDFSLSL